MSAFDLECLDPEEDILEEDVTNAANLTDDMLKINSSFFSKAQWNYLESDKSNTELYQKLAESGIKIREIVDTNIVPFSDEEYVGMRKHLIEKIGSPGDKCFPDLNGEGGDDKKSSKDSKSSNKNTKDIKKSTTSGSGKKGEVVKKADVIKRENMMKLIREDVDKMSVNRDVSLPHLRNWFQSISLLVHVMQWAIHVILALRDKYKDPNTGKLLPVSTKVAIDCAMSLYRAMNDMRGMSPVQLIADVEYIAEKLSKALKSKCGDDLIGLISLSHPELISDTSYDSIKPYGIGLYPEQQRVVKMIDESVASKQPALIGYRVPPSGGKTVLSVSIAAMLHQYHRGNKKVLYVCYNTLVRLAVANACTQANVPYWVASTWLKDGEKLSAIRPSNSCMDFKRDARARRKQQAIGGQEKV
jgi:hypothetical protein